MMAASLNELMKPTRFDVDPSSPKAAKQFKHWSSNCISTAAHSLM